MELENIYMLSVGQLRELLAYACAEESVDSWWEDITEEDLESVGFYDEEDDCDYDGDSSYYDDVVVCKEAYCFTFVCIGKVNNALAVIAGNESTSSVLFGNIKNLSVLFGYAVIAGGMME